MFGLSAHDFKTVMQILHHHSETLAQVILFGSRARGDFHSQSDIDLAVTYDHNHKHLSHSLQADFETSNLPYKVDIVDLSLENKTKLAHFIATEGIMLFDKTSENTGAHWMTIASLNEKLDDFQQALIRLDEALLADIEKNSLFLDGTIQRFEFTYELCWKLIKAYLNHLGVEVNNPRDTIREGLKQKIISENKASDWFIMLEKRNQTTHTYHHAMALEVYTGIKTNFIHLLHQVEKTIAPMITAVSK